MTKGNLAKKILGALTVLAPILTLIADMVTRDREMDEIAERVADKLNERDHTNAEKTATEAEEE